MRRLPSWEERRQRALRREQRWAELRQLAAAQREEIQGLVAATATAASRQQETPDERLAAQLDRLAAARLAVQLAGQLLQVDRPHETLVVDGPSSRELQEQLIAALGRWRRSSEGSWEWRIVPRPQFNLVVDPQTGKKRWVVEMVSYGPYLYFRWHEEGKLQTRYHGKNWPDEVPEWKGELPPPEGVDEALLLQRTRDGIARARRLHALLEEPLPQERRERVIRLLRQAVLLARRRLRADPISAQVEQE